LVELAVSINTHNGRIDLNRLAAGLHHAAPDFPDFVGAVASFLRHHSG
jgi:hypothetical protein